MRSGTRQHPVLRLARRGHVPVRLRGDDFAVFRAFESRFRHRRSTFDAGLRKQKTTSTRVLVTATVVETRTVTRYCSNRTGGRRSGVVFSVRRVHRLADCSNVRRYSCEFVSPWRPRLIPRTGFPYRSRFRVVKTPKRKNEQNHA